MMPFPASSRFFKFRTGRRRTSLLRLARSILPVLLLAPAGCARWPAGRESSDPDFFESRPDAAALYARGLSHEWSGETVPALECYRSAHALDPAEPLVLERLAATLSALQRSDEAIHAIESSVLRFPESAALHELHGRFLLSRREWDAASAAFTRAIDLAPELPTASLFLARARDGAGCPEEALLALDAAWKAGADPAEVLRFAGGILVRNAKGGVGAATVQRVRQWMPPETSDPAGLLLAYQALAQSGEPDLTAVYLERAVETHPGRMDLKLRLAITCLTLGDRARGVQLLNELSEQEGDETSDVLRLLAALAIEDSERSAEAAQVQANRELALSLLERLREREPDSMEGEGDLVRILVLLQRVEDALRIVEAVPPDQPTRQRDLAVQIAGSAGEAPIRAELERLAAERPELKATHLVLGHHALAKGQAGLAADAFERATRVPGAEAALISWCAAAILRDATEDTARSRLQRAQEVRPRDPLLLELRSNLEWISGRFEEAAYWLERAFAESGGRAFMPKELDLKRAHFLSSAGRMEQAREVFAGALAGDSSGLKLYMGLCVLWTDALPDVEPVRRLMEHARELMPEDGYVPFFWGFLERSWDNPAGAAALFGEALQKASRGDSHPEWLDPQFFFLYGSACDQTGQTEMAIDLLKQCIEGDPQHSVALNYLAYLWALRGEELDPALELVRRALALRPDDPAYLDTLAWILFRKGSMEQAKEAILRALETAPDEPEILDHAGDISEAMKEPEAALKLWERAFVLHPDQPGVREKLTARGVDPEKLLKETVVLDEDETDPREAQLYDLVLQGLDPAEQ
jgi:tetratricopeptide (TPR) repeat protein